MTALSLFLGWLTTHVCLVWVPGPTPPWTLGGVRIAFGGSCVDAFSYAAQIPGAILQGMLP